jgi:hypothetical protein
VTTEFYLFHNVPVPENNCLTSTLVTVGLKKQCSKSFSLGTSEVAQISLVQHFFYLVSLHTCSLSISALEPVYLQSIVTIICKKPPQNLMVLNCKHLLGQWHREGSAIWFSVSVAGFTLMSGRWLYIGCYELAWLRGWGNLALLHVSLTLQQASLSMFLKQGQRFKGTIQWDLFYLIHKYLPGKASHLRSLESKDEAYYLAQVRAHGKLQGKGYEYMEV